MTFTLVALYSAFPKNFNLCVTSARPDQCAAALCVRPGTEILSAAGANETLTLLEDRIAPGAIVLFDEVSVDLCTLLVFAIESPISVFSTSIADCDACCSVAGELPSVAGP